jgi:hypothetical protein
LRNSNSAAILQQAVVASMRFLRMLATCIKHQHVKRFALILNLLERHQYVMNLNLKENL